MQKYFYTFYLVIIVLIASSTVVFAQFPDTKKRGHLTPYEVFFGEEDIYQVCYPRSHRMYYNTIIVLSISSIGLLSAFLIMTRRKNKTLNIKNDIIETQNKELLDSIIYAQRIQNALLPTHNTSDNTKVFFQPKNIVSGDFYWLYSHGNYKYFSVIDCTGHGVPGAFLSMLAHSAINNAIIEQKLINPKEILIAMNQQVNSALHQNENKHIRDGMEVGICVLNTETNVLEYAGAGIKLLYISNDNLQEIKASKCTVGSDNSITNDLKCHPISMQKGDRIFMNSDGITDQFGHVTNKKFSSKRLKQLIENTAAFDFKKQQESIEQEIVIWKGNTEQTDDMLMMSIEV